MHISNGVKSTALSLLISYLMLLFQSVVLQTPAGSTPAPLQTPPQTPHAGVKSAGRRLLILCLECVVKNVLVWLMLLGFVVVILVRHYEIF